MLFSLFHENSSRLIPLLFYKFKIRQGFPVPGFYCDTTFFIKLLCYQITHASRPPQIPVRFVSYHVHILEESEEIAHFFLILFATDYLSPHFMRHPIRQPGWQWNMAFLCRQMSNYLHRGIQLDFIPN